MILGSKEYKFSIRNINMYVNTTRGLIPKNYGYNMNKLQMLNSIHGYYKIIQEHIINNEKVDYIRCDCYYCRYSLGR